MTDQESPELKEALDRGSGRELPPNRPPGLLGEPGLNLRKTDPTSHGLNAGLTQENDEQMTFLWVVLAYIVFFPLAYVILWRSCKITKRSKVWTTAAMTVGVVAVVAWFATHGGLPGVGAR
jgi:hypothetical protein